MVRSVVATGKIEPITKVEIKSKANGIIKVLPVEVDQEVEAGTVLVELDRENLMARVREARATLQGAKAAHQAAEAQYAEEPGRSRRAGSRVRKAVVSAREEPVRAQARRAVSARGSADSARPGRKSKAGRGIAALDRQGARRRKRRQMSRRHRPRSSAPRRSSRTRRFARPIRGRILARDVEVGSPVSSILNMGVCGDAGRDDGRHLACVRSRKSRRNRDRQPAAESAGAHHSGDVQGQGLSGQGDANFADGRRARQRHEFRGARVDRQSRQRAEGEHDGQRRDRARGAAELAHRPRGRDQLRR